MAVHPAVQTFASSEATPAATAADGGVTPPVVGLKYTELVYELTAH